MVWINSLLCFQALPSAKGHIDAHGSAKCTLTWRREANVEKWSDAQQPKMLLVLDFLHDKTKNEKHTLTRLIGQFSILQVPYHISIMLLLICFLGKVVSGQTCNLDKPPIEQLMLDAATDEYSRLTSRFFIFLKRQREDKASQYSTFARTERTILPKNLVTENSNYQKQ